MTDEMGTAGARGDTLHILWTTGDAATARHMVMMYARNSLLRGWWGGVTVVIWGAAQGLAARDPAVQDEMRVLMNVGVKFSACVSCAMALGVRADLEALGVEVIPWGQPLTDLLKGGAPLLTV
ncbi:MAG TPA: DsrE family protein [Candidatus Limnocylindria bacterium]|nr:DsrE family protein [Candidatus Limnocylindria bacterium]